MKRVLHVGCGSKDRTSMPAFFQAWEEVRLDINPIAVPDIVASMTDMNAVPSASFDAVYSVHNLEHLYAHEVPAAVGEFRRVLKNDGFACIAVPDLEAVAKLIAAGKLDEPAYQSSAGSVAALDILYGHRGEILNNPWMVHRTGFTARTLAKTLGAVFARAICAGGRNYELQAIASCAPSTREALDAKLLEIFPKWQ